MQARSGIVGLASAILILVHAAAFAQTPSAQSCSSLASQQLPNTTITTAEANSTGSFTPAGSTNSLGSLPPFCRVVGVIAPTPDSQIVFEAWLPLDNWNGKFAGVGNGGWAGTVSFGALADQLRRGYATASTNTGHEASPGTNAARFAFDKPEQLIDFAYRAHHETAVQAKALVQTFYGKPAARRVPVRLPIRPRVGRVTPAGTIHLARRRTRQADRRTHGPPVFHQELQQIRRIRLCAGRRARTMEGIRHG